VWSTPGVASSAGLNDRDWLAAVVCEKDSARSLHCRSVTERRPASTRSHDELRPVTQVCDQRDPDAQQSADRPGDGQYACQLIVGEKHELFAAGARGRTSDALGCFPALGPGVSSMTHTRPGR
jgi:hypothetical protein